MVVALLSGAGDVAASPFIVPVAACLMVLGIVIASVWAANRSREMKSQERLAAIARGITLPPSADELAIMHGKPSVDRTRRHANVRLWGIVLLGAATGMIFFFVALASIVRTREVLSGAAVALIPLGIGIGLLIDAHIQSREMADATLPDSPSTPYSARS